MLEARFGGSGSRTSFLVFLSLILLLQSIVGCRSGVGSAVVVSGPTTVVLTFDDGPFPPDVRDPVVTPADGNLLDPLRQILATLRDNHAQAVFYLVGPDDTADSAAFRAFYSAALGEMHDAGHVLGYHAYHHDRRLWSDALRLYSFAVRAMSNDMDQLAGFLDETLAADQLTRDEAMSPIFRQPYGGREIDRAPAIAAARAHGWNYHGFLIDSADWTSNVDAVPAFVARLPVSTEAEHVAFTLRQLHDGAGRNRDRRVVDVLFHVNHFTAAHLQEWIDALRTDFTTSDGQPPTFSVPAQYIDESDPFVDSNVTNYVLHFHRR